MEKLSDLNKRLAVTSIVVAVLVVLIGFAHVPFFTWIVMGVIAALAGIGVWEYASLAEAKDLRPAVVLMIVIAVSEVISFFISIKYLTWQLLPLLVLFLGLIAFFIYHFRGVSAALVHLAVEFFGVCYVAVPLSLMLGILYLAPSRWWLVFLLLVTKMTDVGAYFIGKLWGKHKLAPSLSPKKTIEGALGGFIAALLASLAMSGIGQWMNIKGFHLSYFDALWLGGLLSILGQIGDLSESLLKRDAFVKDSNRLPGLGGVLDLLDSLLLTAPVLFFFVTAKI